MIYIIALVSKTVTPTHSPVKCSKDALGSREPCISEQVKQVSGSLTITGFCYFDKNSQRYYILNTNKTAKM